MKIKSLILSFLGILFITSSYGATDCSEREQLRFEDGSKGCASEYKFFTVKLKNAPNGILSLLPANENKITAFFPRFSIASNKNLAKCPVESLSWYGGVNNYPTARLALKQCEDRLKEKALQKNIDVSDCSCEVVYEASANGYNVPFSKNQFAEKTRLWLTFLQDYENLRGQFTQEEIDSNKQFYAEYKSRMLSLGSAPSYKQEVNPNQEIVGQNSLANTSTLSCSFKTQIKYDDGKIECIEESPLGNQIPKGESTKLVDLIKGARAYVVAQSKDPKCTALGFGSMNQNSQSWATEEARKIAIGACSKDGCSCSPIISDGVALIPKAQIMASISPLNSEGKIALSSNQRNKTEPCNFKTQIKYQDGSIGCLDQLEIASKIPKGESLKVIDSVERSRHYYIAQSVTPGCSALSIRTLKTNVWDYQYKIEKDATFDDCKAQGCDCAITIASGNVLVPKNKLELYSSVDFVKTPNPNPPLSQGILIADNLNSNTYAPNKNTESSSIQEQKELAQKQRKEAELQAIAEKERKLAEDRRLQAELAEKVRIEKEQKLAEEKRIKDELTKVAQLEKERKLAEDKRLQAELAEKVRIEKEQKEIAQKQKKESELLAIANSEAVKHTFTGKKIALVIGNAKYSMRPLDNPKNDADDISKTLKGVGFEVIDVRDANLSQMRSAIRSFGDKLLNNEVGLVYYSGHGIEVKGRNYFIPVNADIKRSDEIADQSIDVGLILDKMETAQKPVNILIVDACRDDPFGRSFRSGSRGLATMDAPQGTIIAFATSPGKVAADGDGRNSPYTKNLVLAMQEPNIPIEQVFKKVRRAVQQETKNQQTPWENTSLSGDFYFKVK